MQEKIHSRWCIWLDELQKIASFHAVVDYELHAFLDHANFMHYATALIDSGYRFQ